jgi:aminoglycoside phosphotransferase (APT) family kinase protein
MTGSPPLLSLHLPDTYIVKEYEPKWELAIVQKPVTLSGISGIYFCGGLCTKGRAHHAKIGEARRMHVQGTPALSGTPSADYAIDVSLVHGLLSDQHPDLANLPLQFLDAGWDNALFRLGEQLLIRLPRRSLAAVLIEHEQQWLPGLAERLPLAIPVPLRVGHPGRGYPWKWSVVPWLKGRTADHAEPHAQQAIRLAQFLRALHVPAPDAAPQNAVRGVPLAHRAEVIEARLRRLEATTNFIAPAIRQAWALALEAPRAAAATWLHGDLHPRNVLVEDGAITGIIDWGDMTAGDVATDLASIWMLFGDQRARRRALQEYGALAEATLHRARGWAVLFGVVLLETGLVDNPQHLVIGQRTLSRIAEDMGLF